MDFEFPMYQAEIRKLLPHRYPLLLVDRVLSFEKGVTITGKKNVSANEDFFNGHFPEQPIMPGVLMLEALAQLGVLFSKLDTDRSEEKVLEVFAGVDEVRFRRQVVPGDVLELKMSLLKRRRNIWKMEGIASVDGEVAVQGILTSSVIPVG